MALSLRAVHRHQPSPVFSSGVPDSIDVLRAAFEGSPDGKIVADEGGTILLANARASTIFDYPLGALIGLPLSQLLPGTPARHDDQWVKFPEPPHSAVITPGRIPGLRQGGTIVPLELGLRTFDAGTARYVIASIVDISERLELEARLAAATSARLGFQRIIADLTVRFGTIDPDGIDDAVVDGLRQLGETLQLECALLWRWRPGEAMMSALPGCVPSSSTVHEPLPITAIPFVAARLQAGQPCCFSTVDGLPESDRAAFHRLGFRSGAVIPLESAGDGEPQSALAMGSMTREEEWTPGVLEGLRLIAAVTSQAFARRASCHALRTALTTLHQLRERVIPENVELRREVKGLKTTRHDASESAAIQEVLAQIAQVAPTPSTVLLTGETGSGKEVMAQAIHDLSPRHQRQMIRVSCAAIPTSLIESELFGREKGAYTGALSRQIGRFEAANQSTLFLDEIGDLPMDVQVKLLRVLQERVIERLGSTQPVKVDVRIIAATNRNLEDAVRDKTFREDLFYRLNVFPVAVPPLRARVEDIPALVWSFIDEFSKSFGKTIESISKDSLRELQRYPWPGNVRELRNVIERAMILATGPQLVVRAPQPGERPLPHAAMTLSGLEVEHIRAVLEVTGWRVRGAGGAAERLGLKPTTLESRMARLGITRKRAG
jgi:formate hydrogenlyase transcriptional activator